MSQAWLYVLSLYMFLLIQIQLQNEVDLPATSSFIFVIYDDECNVLMLMNTIHS